MNKGPQYSIVPVEFGLKCLSSKERSDQLLQYNLDKNLLFSRWRFTGPEPKTSSDYDQFLNELFSTQSVCQLIKASEQTPGALHVDATAIKLSITSMSFFDKLETSGTRKCSTRLIS